MSVLYVETSALLKRYVQESESAHCQSILDAHTHWITSRITVTETLINLRKRLSRSEFAIASKLFEADISAFNIVEFDSILSVQAANINSDIGLATLDSIHLASALRTKSAGMAFLTYDKRLGIAAKKCGLQILGVQK